MSFTKAALTLCALFCLGVRAVQAAQPHTLKGAVITPDGTLVPEFTAVIRQPLEKPQLLLRRHFTNGEFLFGDLRHDHYQLQISAPLYVSVKLDLDFTNDKALTDYRIVILHTFRNEARIVPAVRGHMVSVKVLQQKIPDKAQEAYLRGVELHSQGLLDEALIEYGIALRHYPKFFQALSDIGNIFILLGRPDSALLFLRRAEEVDDCDSMILLNMAIARTLKGEYHEATKTLQRVLRSEPRQNLALYYMARIQYLEKKYQEAEKTVRLALDSDPSLVDGWLLLAHTSMQQKDYATARDALTHLRDGMKNNIFSRFVDEQLAMLEIR